MIRKLVLLIVLMLSCGVSAGNAAGIAAPPGLLAMWNGRDGASVRADLRRYSADGEAPGSSASLRLDAGEAAYWLGVQDARAGRPDSALAQWRRAFTLRGDFDEGFALIDALCRRAGAGDFAEARAHAELFSQQANQSMPKRAPEAHARLAWTLHLLGRSDSALHELREYSGELYRRAAWTRRFARIAMAAGDHDRAWRALVLLSARTRRQDAEAETLLVRTQQALGYSDERHRLSVDVVLDRVLAEEAGFASALGGRVENVRAQDGFPLQTYVFPSAPSSPRRAPLLFVLSPADTVAAVDSLVAAFTSAGHPVALLAPRGSFGSVGGGTQAGSTSTRTPGAFGYEAWLDHGPALEARVIADAGFVMNRLSRHADFSGRGAWIVGAAGERVTVALAAARAVRGTPALLLVAPRVPIVELAEFRARLRAMKTRTFVQVSPEEPDALEFADLLSRETAPGQVRVADSELAGRGAAIFRGEAKVAARLLAWLEEKSAKK